MALKQKAFSFLPADPLALWQKIHPHPRYGFFLGSGRPTANERTLYMSTAEPARLWPIDPISRVNPLPRIRRELSHSLPAIWPRFIGVLNFEVGRTFDPGLARLPKLAYELKTMRSYLGDF